MVFMTVTLRFYYLQLNLVNTSPLPAAWPAASVALRRVTSLDHWDTKSRTGCVDVNKVNVPLVWRARATAS